MNFVLNNITLTKIYDSDIPVIAGYMQEPSIHQGTLRIPFPYTTENAKTFVDDCQIYEEENVRPRNFAIRNENGLMLGCIGLHYNYGLNADTTEFGYWLGLPHRNKGITTKAIQLLAALAKTQYHLKRLEAKVFDFNIASQRVLQKAGFVEVESIPKLDVKDGRWLGGARYALNL